MKRILPLLLLLCCCTPLARSQGQQITVGPFSSPGLVYVCPVPSGGTPCPSPSSIFSNSTLTTALSNPFSISSQVTITFYAASGQYTIEMPASSYQQVVSAGGGSGTSAFASGQTPVLKSINVADAKYGAKFDGRACFGGNSTITVTSTSNQVTCSTASFTAADVGKQFTASNGCCGTINSYQGTARFPFVGMHICKATDSGSGGVGVVNGTTINICKDSDGTAANATASCSGATCIIAWATNDDAAITSAETDWQASNTCTAIALPAGMTALLQPHFTTPSTSCSGGWEPESDYTAAVYGQGIGATVLGLFSGFNLAGCTANGCFGGYQEANWYNFQFNGFGIGNTGAASSKILVEASTGSQISQVACNAFGGSDTNLIGLSTNIGVRVWGISWDGCGGTGWQVNGSINKAYYSFVGDTLGPALSIQSAADLTDFGSDYGGTGGTQVIVDSGSYRGYGSNLFTCGAVSSTALYLGNAANALLYLNGARFNCAATTSNGIYSAASTQTITLVNSVVGGTSSVILWSAGGNIFIDDATTLVGGGAVTSFAPTCTFTTGGGTSPSCATGAGSTNQKGYIIATTGTGAPGTTGTITLTFKGSMAGPTGAAPACNFQIDNSGTAWGNEAGTQINTQSTSAPVFAWFNLASGTLTALTVSSPYRIDYQCKPI